MKGEYYHTKESVKEYIASAKDVNGQLLIDQLKQVLPENSSLLELGSGPGSDWEILSNSYKTVGSDNSEEFLTHLTSKHPKGEFLLLDAVTLATSKNFDALYSNKVLHHLTNDELKKSINRQAEVIKDKGIVCHSFWKGKNSEVFKGLFVNYHTKETLKTYFETRFEIISMNYYEEFENEDSILVIARKK